MKVNERNMTKKQNPKLVERISDGEILVRNEDGTYSLHNDMMAIPHRWSYDRLFNDKRCEGEFRPFNGIDLDALVLSARRQIRREKDYSLFALQRRFQLRQPTNLGNFVYSESSNIKKIFHQYISDDEFGGFNYTDVVGGPFNEENRYKIGERTLTERYDASYWAKEVANELRIREPENLIFYLRRDPKVISARILISVPDFYRGLTDEEAITKYGEDTFEKMREHMTGITVSKDYDGNIRIPFSDLNYAFRKATGQKINSEMWD